MDTDQSVTVIGAGQAACQLAASLRQKGFSHAITLIGEEPYLPYSRPPLSKTYFKDGQPERLLLRKQAFYDSNDITVMTSTCVTGIDRNSQVLRLSDGRSLGYGQLVLATGARNRVLPIDGAQLAGVMGLRGLLDADQIRHITDMAKNVVIVGGGFIGLEAAAVFRAKGLHVTVLEAASRLMERAVSAPVSQHFLDAHRLSGVQIHLHASVRRILSGPGKTARGVELQDGQTIPADAVLIAAGVVPNVELARDAGLAIDNGVLTDCYLRTSDPMISAIGDCANVSQGLSGPSLRLESVQAAVDHAKCLAEGLTGSPVAFSKTPWFWSDQGDHKLQIAGLRTGADRTDSDTGADGGRLMVRSYAGDRLICVETVNLPGEHMRARRDFDAEIVGG